MEAESIEADGPRTEEGNVTDHVENAVQDERDSASLEVDRRKNCEDLVREHYVRIYNFLWYLCGDAQEAEDLCQETFIKVWKNLKSFQRKSSILTWIMRIARNTFMDAMRRKCIKHVNGPETVDLDRLKDSEPLVSEQLLEKEQSTWLTEALFQLTEPIRTAVILHYREEMSYRQLAKTMDIPVGTAKYYVNQGVHQLRAMMRTEREER